MASSYIKAIDKISIHRITSGQVVVDLQTAVKELVENSLDAGSTNIEIRFKNYGLKAIEVIDNGSGIPEKDFESIALKHHTSKLETYEDLNHVQTFGFRGEALSSLCALCETVSVTTATKDTSPKGTCLYMQKTGEIASQDIVARQKGTTVSVLGLFAPLPVRRKEFERNVKREFNKALNLLHAYALGPCASNDGVRMAVANVSEKGQKLMQLQTQGLPSKRAAAKALWGSKALENVVDLDIAFQVDMENSVVRRLQMSKQDLPDSVKVEVHGLISKFAVGCGRLNMDRQFFYINGRPCNLPKVQKTFNETYRTFNANQTPLIIADLTIPTASCDLNVSPDKRTILLHNEANLISALKQALELQFSPSRSTFELTSQTMTQTVLSPLVTQHSPGFADVNTLRDVASVEVDAVSPLPPSDAIDGDIVLDTTTSFWSQPSNDHGSQSPLEPVPEIPNSSVHTALPSKSPQLPAANTNGSVCLDEPELPPTLNSTSPLTSSGIDPPHTSRKRRTYSIIETPGSTRPNQGHDPELRPLKKRLVARDLGIRLESYAMTGSQSVRAKDVKNLSESASGDELEDEDESPNNLDSCLSRLGCGGFGVDSAKISSESERHARGNAEDHDVGDPDSDVDDPSTILSSAKRTLSASTSSQEAGIPRPEIVRRSDSSTDISVRFDLVRAVTLWNKFRSPISQYPAIICALEEGGTRVPGDANVLNFKDNESAASALSRVLDKSDFASMEVVGQFNLGFIICRRRSSTGNIMRTMDDLFIVDQHAADEKFNFENLQLTTKIQSQKLLRARVMELTAADEMVASENLQVLKDNGFEVEMTAADEGGNRLSLTAQPISKNTIFDVKDLEELIHLLRDSPSGTMVRCSKARTMFASRACRKSVMVGMPLTYSQMSTVVRHMGTMEQPWNCPHGRPTMRHLADITTLGSMPVHPINWTSFG